MKLTDYPRLSESLYSFTARCGLPVKIVPKPGFSRKLAYFVTDFGSIHTEFQWNGKQYHAPAGIAHFLEHKMFELPDRDVTAEFAALGANVNAFTSYDITAYYFSCSENFRENLELLLEFVSTPYFPEESVQREIGIIDQEIAMNADAPDSRIFEDLMQLLFRDHPVRVPILGDSESIRQITPELLTACHRAFYTPENMVLCIIGDADPQEVREAVDKILGTERKVPGKKRDSWQETMTPAQPVRRRTMEVSMPTFQLAFKCEPLESGEASVREEMVGDLAAEALFGESSPLYLKLYQENIIDSSFGGGFESLDGGAMLTCGGDSWDPEAVREAILARAEEILREGLPEEDFLRMKRSAFGRRIRDLDSFDSTCFRICAYHFDGYDYFQFPSVYTSIDRSEICRFLERVVRRERCALSVIEPKEA